MSLVIANFFWHGSCLSLQEHVCISSFIKNGFDVRVYSYTDLEVPKGATLCDASEILPASDLSKYTQAGMKANLAAFSDVFRYQVIRKKGGWWFDTDVLCLASSSQFVQILSAKDIKVSAGFQSPDVIACGVLYLDYSCLTNKILDEIENVGTEFDWGAIGPTLITRVINELNLRHLVEPEIFFYPIHYSQFRRMFDPAWTDWCKSRVDGSLSVHLWNEFIRRDLIPKSIMPPSGSFLNEVYLEVCPELGSIKALPFETIKALFDYSDLKDEHQRLSDEHQRFVAIKNKIINNFIVSLLLTVRSKIRKL
ncbi:glycosyltransferase [Geobacter sp. AOG1]|uniref:glycosyltransferase n=1 Tax=Geobacter sp. AOG1 TaxID=1566346 RepID=UPI001CC5E998|nr:glycosyltransferase [Geobacter sp. AOG1]GFE58489.1 hypothetical protein AOG1_23690 [Geobacter sp. AOG1]